MDQTEPIRRVLVNAINTDPNEREALEAEHGQVWDTSEVQKDFTITGFMAPFVVVKEKATDKEGTLTFQHSPRYYFDFQPS